MAKEPKISSNCTSYIGCRLSKYPSFSERWHAEVFCSARFSTQLTLSASLSLSLSLSLFLAPVFSCFSIKNQRLWGNRRKEKLKHTQCSASNQTHLFSLYLSASLSLFFPPMQLLQTLFKFQVISSGFLFIHYFIIQV